MSDSNMNPPGGLVVGTAGHIDHGKTSLIRALTGIDTDRLREEKQRGISIDLGFAHLTLPGGRPLSFVDVPGHERFIRNMLAGAAGIELVLLIVAANEGVKPQTREHFEICRLLGVERGLIVLTKTDLATPDQLSATRSSIEHLVKKSFLANAPVLSVSSLTGLGLEELRIALARQTTQNTLRKSDGLARLPIDRSFALKGFGTVVTGTLSHGCLRVGDTVRLHPSGREARIRSLQTHNESIAFARAGQRTAVNLSGVDHSELHRGFVLASQGPLETTSTLHAAVNWLAGADVPRRQEDALLHLGTAEITARVRPLSRHFIQLDLAEPVLALPGDRFVLRRPTPAQTIGGGSVLDAFPPKKLSRSKAAERLALLETVSVTARLEQYVAERENGRRLDDLIRLTGQTPEEIKSIIQQSSALLFVEAAQRIVSQAWLKKRRATLALWLKNFHAQNPSLAGAPLAQARLGLENALAAAVFQNNPAIRQQGDSIALATHKPHVNTREAAALLRIEQQFRQAGYQPSNPLDMLRASGAEAPDATNFLERLIKNGRLVRISESLVFHTDVIAHISHSLAAHKGRRFSVPEFKDWTQISRKYAIPLLEYLDRQRITKRDGDHRVVL